MSPAAIASRWPQNRPRIKAIYNSHALILFSRWLTEVPAIEAFDAELMKKTSTSTESMFGLSPRKRRLPDDLEEDDLIGASIRSDPRFKADAPESPDPSNKSEQENFFSKAWAAQKNHNHRPWPMAAEQQHRRREEYSILRSKSGSTAGFPLSYDRQYRDHDRIWQYAADMPPFTQERFVIASYNILASAYACQRRRDLFAHVPSHLLNWKSRKGKILRDLRLCSPDIICLQEVDRFRDLEQDLALNGYVGSYKVCNGGGPDGCAIFWRKERFKLLQEESLEFSELGLNNNIAQLCVLQSLVSGVVNNGSSLGFRMAGQGQSHCVIVGNINVLYNPKRGDIKLGQCRTFLEQAYTLSSSWPGAPVVIAGDFSSTPSSAVYDFLATSELEVSGLDRRYLSGQITKVSSSGSKRPKNNGAKKFGLEIFVSPSFENKPLEAERNDNETLLSSNTSRVSSKVSPNTRVEVSLKERLKKNLIPRFASRKDIYATEFARIAAKALGVCCNNSLDGSEAVNSSVSCFDHDLCCTDGVNVFKKEQIRDETLILSSKRVHEHKNEDLAENPLLSRTIEILECSLGSEVLCGQTSSIRSAKCEGVQENDVFPDLCTQNIMVRAGLLSVNEQATHLIQADPSKLAFFCTPEVGLGESTESRVPVLRSSKQDSTLDSVQGDGFDTCANTSTPHNTRVEFLQSKRINMEGNDKLFEESDASNGVGVVDGADSSKPCSSLEELSAQFQRIHTEGNANFFGESQVSNGVGEVDVNHEGQVEIKCYTTSSSSRHHSLGYNNIQVNRMSGSKSPTNLERTPSANIDTGTTKFSKESQFFNAEVQSGDIEMPNLVEEESFGAKQPPCTSSDQHPLRGCREIKLEGEGQIAVPNENKSDTHESIGSEEASSTPGHSSFSKMLQEKTSLKSSYRPNLRDLDCFSSVGTPVNMSEEAKHDDKHQQWDLEELKRATGDPDCTTVRHKLNLRSVYPEIQGQVGTRDAKGEPLITTYHRHFRGTVDYIWRSDGLKPIKVLDTVPLEAMLVNKGLPSKVWGSYHLAIACELAFIPNQRELGYNKA